MQKSKKRRDRDGLHRRRKIWYYAFTNPLTGKRQEVSTKTRNFNEARDIQRKAMQEHARGLLRKETARITLSDAFAEWIEYATLHYEPSTIRLHRERSKPLLAELGHFKLQAIAIDVIRRYQQKRAGRVSNRTVNLEMQTLRNVMTHYHLWRGAIKGDYKGLPEPASDVGRALTPEQQLQCWLVAQSSYASMRTYNMSVFYSNTGLRKAEFLGLTIGQLNLDAGELHVRKSKTSAGKRIVPLNEHALVAGRFILEMANRRGSQNADDYLFPAFLHRRRLAGEKRSGYDASSPQKTFRTAWRNFTRKCGLKGLRVHDLRHHFVTTLAEADVPLATAKSIVGHMSDEMVAHYTHIRDRAKRQAVKSLESSNVISAQDLAAALMNADAKRQRKRHTPLECLIATTNA